MVHTALPTPAISAIQILHRNVITESEVELINSACQWWSDSKNRAMHFNYLFINRAFFVL